MVEIEISKHEFVPKHVKISEKEAEALLFKYNVSKKQLPKILKNDPAIKDMDLKSGDILKIIRKSPTCGESTYYRVVVNA
ncbi:MAG: DNA-directed RNA polymerase subunit H [Nanoarchaeota archaeon]|nr:DNA-directed RNA polymerase subunit H [Nanoarchaeota archaeon]